MKGEATPILKPRPNTAELIPPECTIFCAPAMYARYQQVKRLCYSKLGENASLTRDSRPTHLSRIETRETIAIIYFFNI